MRESLNLQKEGLDMSIALEITEEILQIQESGKRGIVLVMEHHKEWESVVANLQSQYSSKKKVVLQVLLTASQMRREHYEVCPVFYSCEKSGRKYPVVRDELKGADRDAVFATGLLLWGNDSQIGMIVIENYHLLDRQSQLAALPQMLQLLVNNSGPLILFIVKEFEQIPKELYPYVYFIKGRKPSVQELRICMEECLEKLYMQKKISDSFKSEIVSNLQGFHEYDIPYLFQRALLKYGDEAFGEDSKDTENRHSKKVLELVGNEKVKLLEKEQLLEWKFVKDVAFANMDVLKEHLHETGKIIDHLEEARAKGVDTPKGILILGLPGTGKSLFAHYAAAKLHKPLLRLDMGRMMGGLVGDSERNLRNAQKQAEEMAPCILWIDEIEKGFAGANGKGREEGAYLQRMLGSFLTWLQEKESSCYVIATANSNDLPPEFFRKGRFDECFCTLMPTGNEIREILKVHLNTKERRYLLENVKIDDMFNELLAIAVNEKKFMTGADAAALVSNVCRQMFLNNNNKDLKNIMIAELRKMKVFSQTNGSDIARHAIAARTTNFINASGENHTAKENISAGVKAYNERYDRAMMAFIKQEEEKLKQCN